LNLFFKIYNFLMIFLVWGLLFFVFPGTAESLVKGFPECPFWGPRNQKFEGFAVGRQIRTPTLATVEPRECLR
jgi:hypothetical protein